MISSMRTKVKAAITSVIVLMGVGQLHAQQEPQYSQFMYNKLPINSAYTGGRDALSLRALYRDQWSKLDGHPRTATLSGHSPLKNENIAVGGELCIRPVGRDKADLDQRHVCL